MKYDSVRVAMGLAHMADDLRKYAAKAACPVAILRGTHSSELTTAEMSEEAKDAISHRGRALRALAPVIAELLSG